MAHRAGCGQDGKPRFQGCAHSASPLASRPRLLYSIALLISAVRALRTLLRFSRTHEYLLRRSPSVRRARRTAPSIRAGAMRFAVRPQCRRAGGSIPMPRRRQIIICIPGILATFCVILRYLKTTGSALSGIWRTSYFMGWFNLLAICIRCSQVAAKPKEPRLLDG